MSVEQPEAQNWEPKIVAFAVTGALMPVLTWRA
jgi:hypothetical protein